jgi:FkbM family methyltransferase
MLFERDVYINSPSPIESELKLIFNSHKSIVIFDIGSCEGEDSIKYAKIFPNAKIFAVEALPSNVKLLEANLKKYSDYAQNIEIIPFALSDETGDASFYVSSGQIDGKKEEQDWDYGNKSSSLLSPEKHLEITPWLKFPDVIKVETRTIKNVCSDKNIDSIDFIHMDVQGAELKVLNGAGDSIERIKLIWLEVEAIELYKDQPLKKEVEKFMSDHNFYKIKDTVDSIAGDQLYINLNHPSSKIIVARLAIGIFLQKIFNKIENIISRIKNRIRKQIVQR